MTNEPRLGNGLGGLCQKPQRLIEVQWSGIIEDKNRKDFTNSILMPFEEDDIGDTVGYQWYSMVFYNEINIIKTAFWNSKTFWPPCFQQGQDSATPHTHCSLIRRNRLGAALGADWNPWTLVICVYSGHSSSKLPTETVAGEESCSILSKSLVLRQQIPFCLTRTTGAQTFEKQIPRFHKANSCEFRKVSVHAIRNESVSIYGFSFCCTLMASEDLVPGTELELVMFHAINLRVAKDASWTKKQPTWSAVVCLLCMIFRSILLHLNQII